MDFQAREYLERALDLWRVTGGLNLTGHAIFQITQGYHQEIRREWIGWVLENYYARLLQIREEGTSAACWGEISDVGKILKVIVNPEGLVVTAHFDRGELRRLLSERGETTR